MIFDITHVLDITHKGRKCYNLFYAIDIACILSESKRTSFFLTGDERAWHGFIDIVFSSHPLAAVTSSELIGKILNIWKKKSYFRNHTVTIVFDSLGSLKYTTVLEKKINYFPFPEQFMSLTNLIKIRSFDPLP